jgi:hypothetical protein
MQHHHTLHLLFIQRLTNNFQVSELGINDQQNGPHEYTIQTLTHTIISYYTTTLLTLYVTPACFIHWRVIFRQYNQIIIAVFVGNITSQVVKFNLVCSAYMSLRSCVTHTVLWYSSRVTHTVLWYSSCVTHTVLWYSSCVTHTVLWYSSRVTRTVLWYSSRVTRTVLWYSSCVTHTVLWYSSCVTHTVLWYSSCVKQYTLNTKLNFTTGDSFCFLTSLDCFDYTLWMWLFDVWKKQELCIVSIKWWYDDMWVNLLVFVWYSNTSVWIRTR